MVGMQARPPNCTCLKSRLTSHSPLIWAHGCVWIIFFFSHKNANFRIKLQKHEFDYNIKLRGTTGTLTYQFFLKSIDLKVPNLIAPLKGRVKIVKSTVCHGILTAKLYPKSSLHNQNWPLIYHQRTISVRTFSGAEDNRRGERVCPTLYSNEK